MVLRALSRSSAVGESELFIVTVRTQTTRENRTAVDSSELVCLLVVNAKKGAKNAAFVGCSHVLIAVLVSGHGIAGDSSGLPSVMGSLASAFYCPTCESLP